MCRAGTLLQYMRSTSPQVSAVDDRAAFDRTCMADAQIAGSVLGSTGGSRVVLRLWVSTASAPSGQSVRVRVVWRRVVPKEAVPIAAGVGLAKRWSIAQVCSSMGEDQSRRTAERDELALCVRDFGAGGRKPAAAV